MYKLFAAAQAIEFSVGCHAKCSNFVVKSKEFPFASTLALSAPVQDYQYIASLDILQEQAIYIIKTWAKLIN